MTHRRATTIPTAALVAGVLALAAGATLVSRPALAQATATPAVPAEGGPLRVTVKTIDEGECKIGEGGAGLYRSASGRHKCGLYPAPDGTIFLVVDEGGEGVDVAPANRGAKLNTPDGRISTCGRGSMLILAVITTTTENDGFQRADYDAVCVPGPFPPHAAK